MHAFCFVGHAAARRSPRATLLAFALACALALAASPAEASIESPFVGTRTLAMGGAQRGLGASNDVLLLNPAAMAMAKRYSAEVGYETGGDHVHRVLMSTVDSKSGGVAAGLSYMRVWGKPSHGQPALGEVRFGLAYSLLPVLSIGVSGQNVSGHIAETPNGNTERVRAFSSTMGAMLHLGPAVGLGVAWENYATKHNANVLPRALTFGAGLSLSMLRIAADFRLFPAIGGTYRRDLGVGVEASPWRALALRAGYRLATGALSTLADAGVVPGGSEGQRHKNQWVTAGLGLNLGGVSIDVGMEKPLLSNRWRMASGICWFL